MNGRGEFKKTKILNIMWLILVPLFILGRLCYKFYQFLKAVWKIEDNSNEHWEIQPPEESACMYIVKDDDPEANQLKDNIPHWKQNTPRWKLVEKEASTHPII
jgi:flagellar basal body-associated protein FliL